MDQTQVPQDAPSNVAPADNISAPATPTPKNPATPATSPRRRNLPLVIALILFVLAIVGLTAAIVIATQTGPSDDEIVVTNTAPSDDATTNVPSLSEQIYENAVQIITSNIENPYEEVSTYFNDLLSIYTDPNDVFDIESTHITVLIDNSYYDEALPVIDKLQELASTDEQLITVYLYYSFVYGRTCENADKSNEYNEKAQELIDKTQEDW